MSMTHESLSRGCKRQMQEQDNRRRKPFQQPQEMRVGFTNGSRRRGGHRPTHCASLTSAFRRLAQTQDKGLCEPWNGFNKACRYHVKAWRTSEISPTDACRKQPMAHASLALSFMTHARASRKKPYTQVISPQPRAPFEIRTALMKHKAPRQSEVHDAMSDPRDFNLSRARFAHSSKPYATATCYMIWAACAVQQWPLLTDSVSVSEHGPHVRRPAC